MSPAHGLVDHDGDDGLSVHHGPAAKTGGTLTGVNAHGHCGVRKLITRGGKARGDDGEPHRRLHGSV
jgi:hypothetical protein